MVILRKGRLMDRLLAECKADSGYNGYKSDGTSHKVLIIDDAVFVRKQMKKILGDVGYELVGEAENGKDGFDKFCVLQPTVVTLDITMPVMSGPVALEKILKRDSSARVVMVSAMGSEDHVKQAILKGAKSFVVKPITMNNLKSFLRTIKNVAGNA